MVKPEFYFLVIKVYVKKNEILYSLAMISIDYSVHLAIQDFVKKERALQEFLLRHYFLSKASINNPCVYIYIVIKFGRMYKRKKSENNFNIYSTRILEKCSIILFGNTVSFAFDKSTNVEL